MITFLFQSLSSTSLFASRPFLTAFLIAMGARVGFEAATRPEQTLQLVGGNSSAVASLSTLNIAASSWLISNPALYIFGILMVLELIANHESTARPLYNDAAGFFRTGGAFVINYGLVDIQSAEMLQLLARIVPHDMLMLIAPLGSCCAAIAGSHATQTIAAASILTVLAHGVSAVWAVIIAGITWFIGTLRAGIVDVLTDADDDNSIGIHGLMAWSEELWVVLSVVVLVVLPLIALGLFALTVGALYLIRKWFEQREKRSLTFADMAAINSYLRVLDKRLPHTLLICFVLGLVPVVGVVPAVVYYRLSLIASLRGYIPRATGCLTRWAVRAINLVLICLQWIPLVGALMLPAMCLINYTIHRKVMEQTGISKLGRTFAPMAAPVAVLGPGEAAAPMIPFAAPKVQPARSFCTSCGNSLEGQPRFCTKCGAQQDSK